MFDSNITNASLDVHTLIDVVAVVVSVAGGYFAAIRAIDKRLKALEIQVAIILDRDRRRRISDYEDEGIINRES